MARKVYYITLAGEEKTRIMRCNQKGELFSTKRYSKTNGVNTLEEARTRVENINKQKKAARKAARAAARNQQQNAQ